MRMVISIHGEDVDLLHLPLGNNVVVIYVRRKNGIMDIVLNVMVTPM
tara:strand:- start:1214 stop:1354 length:141 start_codon:yes stop_codon:yes gene_type:complete